MYQRCNPSFYFLVYWRSQCQLGTSRTQIADTSTMPPTAAGAGLASTPSPPSTASGFIKLRRSCLSALDWNSWVDFVWSPRIFMIPAFYMLRNTDAYGVGLGDTRALVETH